jgi:hypothetical protein
MTTPEAATRVLVSDLRQSWRLEIMNGSKPYGPSGGSQAPSTKRTRPGLRVSCSPSPPPSPRGEGERSDAAGKFGRCGCRPRFFVHRFGATRQPTPVVLSKHWRMFLPLPKGEGGVRGNEANSNPRRTMIPGAVKLRESPGRFVFSVAQISNLLYRRIAFCGAPASANALELSDALPIKNRRYGRLEICATRPRCALNTFSGRVGLSQLDHEPL